MISKPTLAALFLAAVSISYAQAPSASATVVEPTAIAQNVVSFETKPVIKSGVSPAVPSSIPETVTKADRQTVPDPYVRPNPKRRMKNYINSIAGPVALIQYVATPALLTGRNSPSEWGGKWEGYGKRVANVVGKSLIRNTMTFALDEVLKVDSSFYYSKDRSVKSRLKNSVASTFTALDKNGKRVIGIPRITGAFLSEVVSSTTWYPPRYDYIHGLKGGIISLGVSTGFNLFKEFVLKK